MLALRLVMDTNVLVSAALKPESLQNTVFLIAITKPARLFVSPPILEEYAEVLGRRELRIRKGLQQQLIQLIKNRSRWLNRVTDLRWPGTRTTTGLLNAQMLLARITSSRGI